MTRLTSLAIATVVASAAVTAALGEGATTAASRPRVRAATGMPALLPSAAVDDAAIARLKEISAGQRALYAKISGSLLRVRVEQNVDGLLPEKLRGAFEQWRERAGRDWRSRSSDDSSSHGRGSDASKTRDTKDARPPMMRPGMRPGEGFRRPEGGTSTAPSRLGMQGMWLLERFLESQTSEGATADAAEAQAALARLRAIRSGASGDMYAVVYDTAGHAILLSGVSLPKDKEKLQAYAADGTELSAKVVGTDARRGLTVLAIDSAGQATPAAMAEGKPAPGDLLMCVSATSGSVRWISAPLPGPSRKREERFGVVGFDERAGFMFNTDGQLAALVVERNAVPVSAITGEIAALAAGRTTEPRPLGVKYDPVEMNSPERAERKHLGYKPALKVTEVIAGSPAQKAGIEKGDYIISFDGKPVTQMRSVLAELATKTTPLRVGIVRGDEVVEKEIGLER